MHKYFNDSTYVIEQYSIQISSISDIVMENVSIKDNLSSDSIQKNLGSVIKYIDTLVHKIIAWITEFTARTKNTLKKIWESDKGFQRSYSKIKSERQPLKGIKVIKYAYDNNRLDMMLLDVKNLVSKLYQDIKRDINLNDETFCMTQSKTQVEEFIINNIGKKYADDKNAPSNISELYNLMKTVYRKNKEEILITPSNINEIEKGLNTSKEVMSKINEFVSRLRSMADDVRAYSASRVNDQTNDKSGIYKKIVKNFSVVSSFAINFCQYYFDLKVEYQFCCREMLKRLYQF